MDLRAIRTDYRGGSIAGLPPDPWPAVESWLNEAIAREAEPTAFSLATCDAGNVSVRIVLAKEVSPEGVTFYTNRRSPKGIALENHPKAAGVFFWPVLQRQLRFSGSVTVLGAEDADRYFATRPRESQLAAFVSRQSAELTDYMELVRRFEAAQEQFAAAQIPRPEHWGGYRIAFETIEFWQGQPGRLHQRLLYVRNPDGSYRRTWLEP